MTYYTRWELFMLKRLYKWIDKSQEDIKKYKALIKKIKKQAEKRIC